MYEYPDLLVTRSGELHPGSSTTDAAVHLGDRDRPVRLPLDLVEEPTWDPRCEGEHGDRIARQASRKSGAFVAEPHGERK
jgi:hypothetical protein